MSYQQTFELPAVKTACGDLIARNAEVLIADIYENTTEAPFNDPQIRVGTVLKILLRSGSDNATVSAAVIDPVTKDMSLLILETDDPTQKQLYVEELKFLKRCTLLDDLISLNTAAPLC